MSNETIPDDLPTEEANRPLDAWVMPEPIFRSTEGHTPKRSTDLRGAEEVDTLETDVTETDAPAVPFPDGSSLANPVEPPKKKGGCFRSLLFIVGTIALFAAAIIIALIYFLFYARPVDTGTF